MIVDWPAWIQAIGSLIAIAIAIFVPWWQHKLESQAAATEHRLKARSLALAIMPELPEIGARLESAKKDISGLVGDITLSMFPDKLTAAKVSIPRALDSNLDRLYLLGEPAGDDIQQLVAVVAQYNRMIDRLAADLSRNRISGLGVRELHAVEPHLQVAEGLVTTSTTNIEPLHDSGVPREWSHANQ